MSDQEHSTLTKLGLGVLACNSALAIYNSWGDAGSIAFVLAALVLLFVCLRDFERPGRGRGTRIKAAVWLLTMLLTVMFASRVAPLLPVAVGVVVFLCLGEIDRVRGGQGGGRVNTCSALAKVGFAVLACNASLEVYADARRDPGSASAAFVLLSYGALVVLMGLFIRAFAHAQGQQH